MNTTGTLAVHALLLAGCMGRRQAAHALFWGGAIAPRKDTWFSGHGAPPRKRKGQKKAVFLGSDNKLKPFFRPSRKKNPPNVFCFL